MPSTENYITQAAADARYQALGGLSSATPSQVDAGDAGTAGVSTSASRADHEHPVGFDSDELVPAAWLAAWTSWTPTLTNMTLGNGTVVAKYVQMGKTVHYRFVFTLGSSSAVAANPEFSLPVPHASMELQHNIGSVTFVDANSSDYFGRVLPNTTGLLQYLNTTWAAPSGTAPFTWATGDQITVTGTYEAA